eukprot:gene16471-39884_t
MYAVYPRAPPAVFQRLLKGYKAHIRRRAIDPFYGAAGDDPSPPALHPAPPAGRAPMSRPSGVRSGLPPAPPPLWCRRAVGVVVDGGGAARADALPSPAWGDDGYDERAHWQRQSAMIAADGGPPPLSAAQPPAPPASPICESHPRVPPASPTCSAVAGTQGAAAAKERKRASRRQTALEQWQHRQFGELPSWYDTECITGPAQRSKLTRLQKEEEGRRGALYGIRLLLDTPGALICGHGLSVVAASLRQEDAERQQ